MAEQKSTQKAGSQSESQARSGKIRGGVPSLGATNRPMPGATSPPQPGSLHHSYGLLLSHHRLPEQPERFVTQN
ncbi:Hypothetical predicted protein [Marmota monax]|uniref:Uncharacterized protein n=1 Tax=Marmota monax TaxID=9995 RepID=A0A5E4CGV0_MARMO|nr:hypothetical protein GHT09_013072 [Marmota monax]VTJ80111.1 Hypothetical predicted protein [Marmota monax]